MYYTLLDSAGNLIDSFDDEQEAQRALAAILGSDPDANGEVAIVRYDDHGEPVGEATTVPPAPRFAGLRSFRS
jgi:hypothetical protein